MPDNLQTLPTRLARLRADVRRRWPRAGLVGPLFYYDLVRLARRGRSTALRCLYALALLGVLCFVYAIHLPDYGALDLLLAPGPKLFGNELARFAENFAAGFLVLQCAAVLVLTPAYVAGAITEEKERKTIGLLLATDLRDREIVLGKLFARLAHLAGVLLVGVPVLFLMLVFGGINPAMLVRGFAAAGMTLFSVGSLSILCSVRARQVWTAVLMTYALVLLGQPVLWLWWLLPSGVSPFPLVAALGVMHGIVGSGCLIGACFSLRRAALPQGAPRRRAPAPLVRPARATPPPAGDLPPVGDWPLLWKELRQARLPSPHRIFANLLRRGPLLVVFFFLVGPGLCLFLLLPPGFVRMREPLAQMLAVVLMGWWCLSTTFFAAGSVSSEREQHTLDTLLTLPVNWRDVLAAKWLASILQRRWLGYALAVVWLAGALSLALHPVSVLLLATSCAVYLALFASLGLWLSLASRNTLWANFTTAFATLLVFTGSLLIVYYSDLDSSQGWYHPWRLRELLQKEADPMVAFLQVGLNPLRTWWHLNFSWQDVASAADGGDPLLWPRVQGCVLGMLCWLTLAGVLWLAACRRLRRAAAGLGR
jgi:ABC-type transport system involved in multi-copper enzyme maturation permease subunit